MGTELDTLEKEKEKWIFLINKRIGSECDILLMLSGGANFTEESKKERGVFQAGIYRRNYKTVKCTRNFDRMLQNSVV